MSVRRQAIVNVASNWATLLLNTIITFFMAPFVVRHLGAEPYGLWALLGSLLGYLGLIDLGVRGAVTRYVSTHHAAGEHDEAGRITSAGLLFFSGGALIVVILAIGAALGIDRLFSLPTELLGAARQAVLLAGFAIAISIVGSVFGGVIIALQRFDYSNGIEIAITLLRTAATVYLLEQGGSLVELAWIQLASSIVRTLVHVFVMRKLYPDLQLSMAGATPLLSKIVSFGVISTLLNVSGALITYSDSLIIGFFLPLQAVTMYSIGAQLTAQVRSIVTGVSQVLSPMASSLEGHGEVMRVGQVMLAGSRLATLAVLPLAVVFMLRGETFIRLWMGQEFAVPAGEVLTILAFGLCAVSSFQVCVSTVIGLGRHRGLVPAFFWMAACTILMNVILVERIGITGVAWGNLVPQLAISLAFAPWYARLVLGTSISEYLWQAILRPVIAMGPFALACRMSELWWPAGNLWIYFLQIGAILPAAAIGAWTFALTSAERELIWGGLVSRWRSAIS